MRRHIGWFLVVALLLAADAPQADSERDKLQGEWQLTARVEDGQESAGEEKMRIRFTADQMLITEGDNKRTCIYKIDPDHKPPAIEIVPRDGPNKDKKIQGIYQLSDEVLTLCLTLQEDKEPPTDFTAAADSGRVLLKLQRRKK
jgi:uncharacterized protein (TIGR03067 family)